MKERERERVKERETGKVRGRKRVNADQHRMKVGKGMFVGYNDSN